MEACTSGSTGVDEMARLVNGILDIRGRAAIVLLTKAEIRRNERIALDHGDAGFVEQSIKPKPIPKRAEHSNDCEAAFILRHWLKIRAGMTRKGCPSPFLNTGGDRAEMSGAGRPPP